MTPARGVLGRRVGAYLADIVVLFAVLAPLGWGLQGIGGLAPTTGPEIWAALLLGFSAPAWLYFAAADASGGGATLGKRWLGLRVATTGGGRVGPTRALVRTAVKLLPWELAHLFAFGLAGDLGELTALQGSGLAVANLLGAVYLLSAAFTGGRRAVHDLAVGTVVQPGAGRPTRRRPA